MLYSSNFISSYLASKPPDISDKCYMYTTYGMCPSGIACRYGSSHISAEGENIINKSLYDEMKAVPVCNVLDKSLQIALRKKKVSFPRSGEYLKSLEPVKNRTEPSSDDARNSITKEEEPKEETSSINEEDGLMKGGDSAVGNNGGDDNEGERLKPEEEIKEKCLEGDNGGEDGSIKEENETDSTKTVIQQYEDALDKIASDTGSAMEDTPKLPHATITDTGSVLTASPENGGGVSIVTSGPFTDEDRISVKPREKKKVLGL